MTRVLMVIKTTELEYDDRLRKESESLLSAGAKVTVACSLNSNEASAGPCYSAAEFKSFHLKTRHRWPDNNFAALHMLEFGFRFWRSGALKTADLVIIHDPVSILLLPWLKLSGKKAIVWDQHELPPQRILNSSLLSKVFGWCCSKTSKVIQANQARLDYLRERCNYNGPATILNNFVDPSFTSQDKQPLLDNEKSWLKGADFVLLQSGGYPWRHFESVVDAVMSNDWPQGLKVLIVGKVHEATLNKLRKRFPKFDDSFLLVGMVPQMELVRYADNAKASLIFYSSNIKNQELCEANRLYQAISRGCPVITGNNPPMRSIVERTSAGIVLDNDGHNSNSIREAVVQLLADPQYKAAAVAATDQFSWSNQDKTVHDLLHLADIKE